MLNRLLPTVEADSLFSILITAVLATLVAIVLFVVVKVITKFIEKKIVNLQLKRIRSLRLQHQEILTGHQISLGIGKLFTWFRYFCYLIIFYLYINTIFSLFPITRGLSAKLLEQFIHAAAFVLSAAWG